MAPFHFVLQDNLQELQVAETRFPRLFKPDLQGFGNAGKP
jgi:hypothetical protein